MATAPIPQPTGNPLLDNPQLKAALTAQMQQQQAPTQPQGAVMPPGGAAPPPSIHPSGQPVTPPLQITANSSPVAHQMQAHAAGAAGPQAPQPAAISPPQPSMPSMDGAPAPAMAPVKAPLGSSAGARQRLTDLQSQGSGVSQIAHKIEGTQFGQNHPMLGKVLGLGAQIPLQVLDSIAGAASPILRSIETGIPGTEEHHHMLVNQQQRQLGQDVLNEHGQAQTAQERAATANAGAMEPLNEAHVQAETDKEKAQTGAIENAPDKAVTLAQLHANAVNKAIQEGRDPSQDPTVNHLADAITSLQKETPQKDEAPKTIQVEVRGKPHQMAWDQKTGKYDLDQGESGEKPIQAPGITMVIPNAEGGGTVQRLTAGQTVAPGAVSGTQFGAQNTPTVQQRNVAAQANLVHEQMPSTIAEIQQMAPQLGPIMGNWNAFMQGKVGAPNPEIAGLRSDLLMMSSAVALMHARGRLPENLREEFDKTINAPQQSPENLIATLQHIDKWVVANQKAMGGTHGGGTEEPTRPANVPPGYIFKDGPQGKGWYNPNAAAAK